MAFTLQAWGRGSVSLNEPIETLTSGVVVGAPRIFQYQSATDAQATIAGSGYFNSVSYELVVGDVIYTVGTDSNVWYSVTTNSGGVVTISSFSLAGPVGTANITNLAVTTAKLADAAVTSAKLDPSTIQYLTGTLTAAQFNGMYATPVTLVSAAGANTIIVVQDFALELLYGTTQFASGGVVGLQYDTTAHLAGTAATATQAAATFTGAVANTALKLGGTLAAALSTAVVNKPISISNQTGAFTTGDSTFRYWVRYFVLPSAT